MSVEAPDDEDGSSYRPTPPAPLPTADREHGGGGTFKAPAVGEYRNLFKPLVVVEYEADSPAFRRKIDALVKKRL